jgi:predicted phosphate transport protein (TIGR00153 family)
MRLLPREEKFYAYFENQTRLISEAADLLVKTVGRGIVPSPESVKKIQDLEREGDKTIHEIFRTLNETFITPIDPEDIHSLASSLDDVLDTIEDASFRIHSYHIDPIPETMVKVAVLIGGCATALAKSFKAFERNEPVLADLIEVNNLEEQTDDIVRQVVADLFANEKDAIQLIKLKEVYELLEEVTDRCEDVTDVLQNIVVKNG